MFDVLDGLEVAVEKVAAADGPVDVVRLRRLIERLEHAWLGAVRAEEQRGEWMTEGFASPAAWLRERCRMRPGTAARSVRLARRLEELPGVSEAFGAGAISRAHAEVVARAATPDRLAALQEIEPALVLAAEHTNPEQLRQLVQSVTDALDGDGGAAEAEAKHARRYLHVSSTWDGMVALDGLLDPEAGQVVIDALELAMRASRQAGDVRTPGQRRADAAVELCRTGAIHHGDGPGRRDRPQLSVQVDLETIEGRGGPDLAALVRREATTGPGLPAVTLQRLACDAGIARIITDGPSIVLDAGRSTRRASPALWRALVARDRGCVVDGCDRPPGWCEVHHRIPWAHGGPTDLTNCELRCHYHHRAIHEGARGPRAP